MALHADHGRPPTVCSQGVESDGFATPPRRLEALSGHLESFQVGCLCWLAPTTGPRLAARAPLAKRPRRQRAHVSASATAARIWTAFTRGVPLCRGRCHSARRIHFCL